MADAKEFRKKPVVIQAIQWDGTLSGMDEILSVFTDIRTVAKTSHPPTNTCSFWKIGTLEGSHEVSAHDFVIRGVKGEYYPCKPDIFFMTYEPATTTPPADAEIADELLRLAGAFDMSLNNAASVSMNRRAADSLRKTLMQAAAALRALAVPDGFVAANVKNLDVLVAAIERAASKGYLPDAIADAWEGFDYRLLAASKAGDGKGGE